MLRRIWLVSLFMFGVVPTNGAAQTPTTRESEVQRAADAFALASAKGDAAAMAAFFASDVISVSPQSPRPLVGREASRQSFERLFQQAGGTHTVTTDQTKVSGDGTMAYTTGTWSAGFSQGERRITGTGHLLIVWQRVNADWLMSAVSAFPFPAPAR